MNVHGKTSGIGGEKPEKMLLNMITSYITRRQLATIIPRPARMRETFRGASLSDYVVQ